MDHEGFYDPQTTKVLLVLVVLGCVLAEAGLIIKAAKSPELHSATGPIWLLATIFLTSLPGILGIMGYRVADKLRFSFGAAGNAAVRLSRHFLVMTAATYAAMIVIGDFLSSLPPTK